MAKGKKGIIYPVEPWRVSEKEYQVDNHRRNETIFAVGNGYIGVRGNFEEGMSSPEAHSLNGTYINGFYESAPIVYGELSYGLAKNRQTMLNVTDSKVIHLEVDGEKFQLSSGKILSHERSLDMRAGLLNRDVEWETSKGSRVRIHSERIASFRRPNLFSILYSIEPLNFNGEIVIISALRGDVRNEVTGDDPRKGSAFKGGVLDVSQITQDGSFAAFVQSTQTTKFSLSCSMQNSLRTESAFEMTSHATDTGVEVRYRVQAKKGVLVDLEKHVAYFTSKHVPKENLLALGLEAVSAAQSDGFSAIRSEQREYLDEFWKSADIEIDGDPLLQQGIRFNLFHLLQSVGKDGKTNIAAKGVTGEGYEGHYFWDTEIYVLPVFLSVMPEIARKLLEHRHSFLPKARERATEMSQKGALFAWRTIDGEETSSYYPAGTAQYHINADVIHALRKYVAATGDKEALVEFGAEMLFETARLWADLGRFIPGKGFCINGVTGPDEYTAVVNNNAYTNYMAREHLQYAGEVASSIARENPEAFKKIAAKINLTGEEVSGWEKAATEMFLPYDKNLVIIPQDDCFLEKAPWDFKGTPPSNYPLLLHYHSLVIYRHQVLKQADLVLAMMLLPSRFTQAEKKRNYDFYEPLTTHDSSLSTSIHSVMATELGYLDKAYEYFIDTVRTDLDDYHGNAGEGVHCAAMAGSWMSIVCGFAGYKEIEGSLFFRPTIPSGWESYQFRINYQGRLLEVLVTPQFARYRLVEGDSLAFSHRQTRVVLEQGQTLDLPMSRQVRAVIFDLDGVITDSAELHFQAWGELAQHLGLPFDREFNEQLKGVGRMESLQLILSQSSRTYSAQEMEEFACRKNERYVELISTISPSDLLPGISEFLNSLKTQGIKIGLASASRNARAIIQRLGIESFFDVVVDSASVAVGKPDPEIFLRAAEMLGVAYEDCVGVEDSAAGVAGILNANMFAIGVGESEALKGAHYRVKSTRDLNLDHIQKVVEDCPFGIPVSANQ